MSVKTFFKRLTALASCGALSLGSLLPSAAMTAKLGATSAVAVSATMLTPDVAHAQSGKRVCAYEGSSHGYRWGMVMEVSKYDWVTCFSYFAGTIAVWGPTSITAMSIGALYGVSGAAGNRLGGRGFGFRMMQTCEDFTSEALSGHWGGNVCHSMQDYRFYAYANTPVGAGIRKI